MIYRLSKLSILKNKLSTLILSSNLNRFGLKLRNFHLSKMESVSEAAKGWANPGISNIYEKTRPDYNLDSVEFLLEKVGALKPHLGPEPFTIVELGAGTGKFTRAVLKVFEKRAVKNFKIIATEPLKEMCEKFKEMVPNVDILQCAASNLDGLTNNSVDSILAATSFHWFYKDQKAIEEIHRVLKPKAILGLIWYLPDRSVSWIKNIEEKLDPKYEKIKFGINTYDEKVLIPLRDHGGFVNEGADVTSYTYSQEFSLSDVINRYKTKSVVAAAQGDEKELMLQAIEQEMKTNPDTKNEENYIFKFVKKIHWFQKV